MTRDKLTTDDTLTQVTANVPFLRERIAHQHTLLGLALPHLQTALDTACVHYEATGEHFEEMAALEDLVERVILVTQD